MARILIICRDSGEGRTLARFLRGDGHTVTTSRTASEAASTLASQQPELMVLAVADPRSLLKELARPVGSWIRRTPAIAVVSGDSEDTEESDFPGLLEILPMPFTEDTFLARVDAMIRVRDVLYGAGTGLTTPAWAPPHSGARAQRGGFAGFFDSISAFVRAESRLRPIEPYLETAASIVGTVELRDAFDAGHSHHVSTHCASIASALGLGAKNTELLLYAASVHDIGKIALSVELLRKPTFTDADRKLMKFHPKRGAQLIRALTPYAEAADIVLYHHERLDGQGYYGTRSDQIPKLARVLAVAEVFEGMTSARVGSAALSIEEAIDALKAGRNTLYDTDCVDALATSIRPWRNSIPISSYIGGRPEPIKSSGKAH